MQVLNTNLETVKIYQGTTLRVFTPCHAICTVTNELPNECTNPETTLPASMNINLDSSNLSSSQMQELKCFLASFSDMLSTPTGALGQTSVVKHDVVEAHCYFVDIRQTDCEQIRSRINNTDCRMLRPCWPLSTAFKTEETAV